MIIIDNELLGCTSIPALDEINMLQGLSPAIVKSFRTPIQQTLKNALDIVSSEQQNDLFAVWSARKIGSLFVAGKIDEILSFSSCDIETRKQNLPLWRTLTNLSS